MFAAGIPLAIGGFLALIWVVSTEPIWWPALENASQALGPVVGAAVRSLLGNIRSGINALGGWLDHQAAPAVQLTWGAYWLAYQRVTAVPSALNQAWLAMNRIQTQVVPHAVSTEAGARAKADSDLWDSTVGLAEQTQAKATAQVGSERADRITATADLWDSTVGLAEQTQAKATAQVSGEAGARAAGDARLEQLLNIDVSQAETQAQAQISAESGARAAGEARLQANIDLGDLTTRQLLQGELSTTTQAILAQLGTVAAGAAAASAVAEGEIAQIRSSECMKFCNILGGIGALLQGLELAGLLALLTEAYENPEGASQVIHQDLVAPAEQVWGQLAGIFGIKAA